MKTPPSKTPGKTMRILSQFITGASLNRFEAEHLGDHCLNSTISTLTNRHGLTFQRKPEKVANRWGKPCRVVRYSLTTEDLVFANAVLATLNRNNPPSSED